MKTLLRRLSLAAVGFAMALGVGIAIGGTSKAVETQATGPYDDYVAVTDLGDINSYTLYALGNAAGTSFAQNAIADSKISVTDSGTNVGFLRL